MFKPILIILFLSVLFSCNNSERFKIQTIEFESDGCFGTCPIFKIIIGEKRNAVYTASMFNEDISGKEIQGNFVTVIDSAHYKEIELLLSHINFPKLKEKYAVEMTDQPSATLTITYDNGKLKKIEDYGKKGTSGLKQLYKMLSDLRLNQNWK